MSETTRESVERLAHKYTGYGQHDAVDMLRALLTRAEAAEAETEELGEVVVKLHNRIQKQRGQIKTAEAERDALAAKLALAVEALRQIEDGYGANHTSNFARMVASGARSQLTSDTPKEGKDDDA